MVKETIVVFQTKNTNLALYNICRFTFYQNIFSLAGIYIHIPYCKQKCNYCNFHFSIKKDDIKEMIDSMILELETRKNYLNNEIIHSIYFGGGTPSIINSKYIIKIISKIKSLFVINPDAEITMEFNPDDLDKDKLIEIKSAGINRLSIGIQSFHDEDLTFMNRSHNAKEAISSIKLAKKYGFNNLSIDLIYGVQNQTSKMWKANLDQMNTLDVDHFSAYALTVEPNTKLDYLINKQKIKPIDDKKTAEHFKILQENAKKMNYTQYEISNFCKKNKFALHNTSYWKNKNYLGIGPSAHSYNGVSRQWNMSNNTIYISSINNEKIAFQEEFLSIEQNYNEYILTALRTIWGVNLDYVNNHFSESINSHFIKSSKKCINNKDAKIDDNHLILTNKGMLFADSISADLFII